MKGRIVMTRSRKFNTERGSSLVEMAIGASVLMTVIFGVLEVGRLLWTHNALAEAARKGARYAAISTQNTTNVKNMVVYGTISPGGGATPVVYGMTTSNVNVTYSGFGVKQGTVTVEITGYMFNFNVPIFGGGITMPSYKTTLTGESAGYVPANL